VQLTLSFRRAEKSVFWSFVAVAGFLIAGFAAAGESRAFAWGWAIAAGATAVTPGVLWQPWFDTGIRGWNMAMRVSTRVVRLYVLRISYYMLITTIGRSGSSLVIAVAGRESGWIPRETSNPQPAGVLSRSEAWPRDRHASTASDAAWQLCLLPLVLLLKVLSEEQLDAAPPSSTYTLY
jgi:hypothetical protein